MVAMGLLPQERLADLVDAGVPPEQAKVLGIAHLTKTRSPIPFGAAGDPMHADPSIRVGADRNRDTLGAAITDATRPQPNAATAQCTDTLAWGRERATSTRARKVPLASEMRAADRATAAPPTG